MRIESHRFGQLEVNEQEMIHFPNGLVGFPTEKTFVLIRRNDNSPVGWLLSLSTADLAFPVVSLDGLEVDIPVQAINEAAQRAQLADSIESCAVMGVLCASSAAGMATVNLLSPLIVNVETRRGAQVFLEGTTLSTQEPFALRRLALSEAEQAQQAEQTQAEAEMTPPPASEPQREALAY